MIGKYPRTKISSDHEVNMPPLPPLSRNIARANVSVLLPRSQSHSEAASKPDDHRIQVLNGNMLSASFKKQGSRCKTGRARSRLKLPCAYCSNHANAPCRTTPPHTLTPHYLKRLHPVGVLMLPLILRELPLRPPTRLSQTRHPLHTAYIQPSGQQKIMYARESKRRRRAVGPLSRTKAPARHGKRCKPSPERRAVLAVLFHFEMFW